VDFAGARSEARQAPLKRPLTRVPRFAIVAGNPIYSGGFLPE